MGRRQANPDLGLTIFPTGPDLDHPLHVVGESTGRSGATTGGRVGGARVPRRPRQTQGRGVWCGACGTGSLSRDLAAGIQAVHHSPALTRPPRPTAAAVMAAARRANVRACAVLLLLVAAAVTVAADPGSKGVRGMRVEGWMGGRCGGTDFVFLGVQGWMGGRRGVVDRERERARLRHDFFRLPARPMTTPVPTTRLDRFPVHRAGRPAGRRRQHLF